MSTPLAPGRWRQANGYRAFVPDPLPPAIPWKDTLVRVLSDADRLIGRLAGEGGYLPNPHLFIRPFLRREAVLSSKIEGTQATLGELLAAEAGAAVDRSPADLREVANYVTAMEHGLRRLKHLPLSLRLVRELHQKLMRGVRGGAAAPGDFRKTQNWIGPAGASPAQATYVPPPPDVLMDCLGAWERFLHGRTLPPLVQVALAHYQFEAIHPFLDGNGRVGRLVIILFLVERQVLPAPLLYLSAFFEASRAEYYERLRAVTERGEWDAWLDYCLRGVARMSEDVLARARQLNQRLAAWRRVLAGTSRGALLVVDALAENPFVTAKGAARRLNVAFTTAQRAIATLERRGILERVAGERRGRVYCAKALLKMLEAPARLEPRETA
ncbi:MAG TPA: Fic family protein [Gemmatimonadales bacterium]|nr:Fic family protein [Gemmatimonadales bacterium]